MKPSASIRPLLLAAAFTVAGTHAFAAERTVPCNMLPSAVQQYSSKLVSQGATIHSCVKDTSGGKTTYELETRTTAGSRDITLTPGGAVLEVEEQVARESLPSPVATALATASRNGELKKIESVTRGEKIVSYEATIAKNGKQHEIAFHPDGTPMKAD